ncbi:MAG: EF-hand domain-containing protein [Paracoccaceae bacterium]|nr:EF-hand domain-containing protein [Paracoccaceae bacterium]
MDTALQRILVTTVAIVVGVGVANAQDRRGGMPDFATLDADGSGEITAEDLSALGASRFAEIDTNGDGTVSEAEFIAKAQADAAERAAAMFARLDADGDGALSRDALESRRDRGMGQRLIRRADTDGSGGVSEEEFSTVMERMAERGGRWGRERKNR